MKEFLSQYWWAIWGVLATVAMVWYRFVKRGGDEPFLRKVLYSAFPEASPENEQRRKISLKVMIFAAVGILVAIAASLLLTFLTR